MFCNKCGQKIPDGSLVCPACGAPQKNAGPQAPSRGAVKGVRLNGRPHNGRILRHADVMAGGTLEFEMAE